VVPRSATTAIPWGSKPKSPNKAKPQFVSQLIVTVLLFEVGVRDTVITTIYHTVTYMKSIAWIRHVCARFAMRMASNENYAFLFRLQRYLYLALRAFMCVFGPMMLMTGITLIGGIYLSFLLYILPTYPTWTSRITHFIIGSSFIGSIFFNYGSCCLTPPGSPEECTDPGSLMGERTVAENGKLITYMKIQYEAAPGVVYKYCKTCRAIKPPRAHHDSISGKCVYHMDHFCPWMNNCIGYYNYRYFYFFLVYLVAGCFYCMCMTWHSFREMAEENP
jgi:hypothetical protein